MSQLKIGLILAGISFVLSMAHAAEKFPATETVKADTAPKATARCHRGKSQPCGKGCIPLYKTCHKEVTTAVFAD